MVSIITPLKVEYDEKTYGFFIILELPFIMLPSFIMLEFIEPEFIEPEFIEPEFIEPEFIEPEFIEPEFIVVIFEFILFALLVLAASPQAIPNALTAKTAERAKVFFILFIYSCLLLQR